MQGFEFIQSSPRAWGWTVEVRVEQERHVRRPHVRGGEPWDKIAMHIKLTVVPTCVGVDRLQSRRPRPFLPVVPTCVGVDRREARFDSGLCGVVPTCVGVDRSSRTGHSPPLVVVPTCVGVDRATSTRETRTRRSPHPRLRRR